MALSPDFLGFGSKRKTAFQLLDATWDAADIDIRTIDNGVRQLLYQWAEGVAAKADEVDVCLKDMAEFTSYLMRGPELSRRFLGNDGIAAMESRLNAALDEDIPGQESLDARLVKLILTVGLADRDIEAVVFLEGDEDGTD